MKVTKIQNEFLKLSFLPKYEPNIVRISALYYAKQQERNPYNFWFIFWENRWLHKLILKITDFLYSKHISSLIVLTEKWRQPTLPLVYSLQVAVYRFLFLFIDVIENMLWIWVTFFKSAFFRLLSELCSEVHSGLCTKTGLVYLAFFGQSG